MPRATAWPSTLNFVILQTPSQIVVVGGYKKSRNFADELQSAAAQCRALFSQRCRLQRPSDEKSRRVRLPLRRRSEEASIQIRPSVVRTPPSPASQPSPPYRARRHDAAESSRPDRARRGGFRSQAAPRNPRESYARRIPSCSIAQSRREHPEFRYLSAVT